MAIKIQLRRGTEAEFDASHANSAIVPADGEVLVVQPSGTTGGYIVIGDGSNNWLQLKGDADGRFYFMPGYSETQMGGVQPSGSTPLTVTGASGQSVPIFVVEDNTGNDIFKVSDDESSDSAALVAIESHGQTADVVLSVFGQADQDDDASGGDLLRVQPDVGHVGKGLTVDHSGNVSIVPVDDSGVTDTALKVTASGNSDNPIMRVQEADGTDLFKVAQGSTAHIKTLNMGNTPDHADPTNHGVVRSATTPNNTDSGAADDSLIDRPHFRLKTENSGTAIRGKLELNGNSGSSAANAIAITRSGGSGSGEITMDYAGNLEASGKATLADAEIDVTGRTLNDASVLRRDEVTSALAKQFAPFTFGVTSTLVVNTNVGTTEKLIRLSGSDGDNARKLNVSDPENVGSAFTLEKATTDTTVPETSTQDDQTNPYFVKVPANSGSFTIAVNVYYLGGNITTKLYSYTSDAGSSTGRVVVAEHTGAFATAGASNADPGDYENLEMVVNVPNETSDKFYAVSFVTDDTSGSDEILANGTQPVNYIPNDQPSRNLAATGGLGSDPNSQGSRQLLTFFRGTPFTGSVIHGRNEP